MTDFVLRLPIRDADENRAFGGYLAHFLESRAGEVDRLAAQMDAPYVMVRDEPTLDADLRIVVFQLRRAAQAFAEGWERLCAEARANLG